MITTGTSIIGVLSIVGLDKTQLRSGIAVGVLGVLGLSKYMVGVGFQGEVSEYWLVWCGVVWAFLYIVV